MKPALKALHKVAQPKGLVLSQEYGVGYDIEDPDGRVALLIELLDGTRTLQEISRQFTAQRQDSSASDVEEAIVALDEMRLLEDATAATTLSPRELERYASGLAFFGTFATLEVGRHVFQERLRDSHVLLLGVGGLGSTVLLGLTGSGVGHVTLVDIDRVELKNLTRQFLYSEIDIGQPKLARAAAAARARNSDIRVDVVERWIGSPDDLSDLLRGVDVVVCGIDQPAGVRLWVNEVCVRAGIPWISGGMLVTRLVYSSVDPGRSACMVCKQPDEALAILQNGHEFDDLGYSRSNRALGPVASLVGGYVALEVLRYLTGFADPVAAGRVWLIDTVTGVCAVAEEWPRRDDCPVCAGVVKRSRVTA